MRKGERDVVVESHERPVVDRAVGVFLGWALFQVAAARQGFTGFAIPAGQLVVVVVVGAIAGVLAGLRPARRAARLDVLQAVATT